MANNGKICTMNCGPSSFDTRTEAQRRAECDDCLSAPAPPAATAAPSDDSGLYDLSTSAGGRAYVAEFFVKRLRRSDFTRYINETLAADFACALAQHLASYGSQPAANADPVYLLAEEEGPGQWSETDEAVFEWWKSQGTRKIRKLYAAPVAAQAPMSDEAIVAEALLFADSSYYGTDLVKRLHFTREGITAFVRSLGGPQAPAANGDGDPLQGAADWLVQAHSLPCPTVISASLMIGYNRAKRLYDAAMRRTTGSDHD